jgi:hypothetical protein
MILDWPFWYQEFPFEPQKTGIGKIANESFEQKPDKVRGVASVHGLALLNSMLRGREMGMQWWRRSRREGYSWPTLLKQNYNS